MSAPANEIHTCAAVDTPRLITPTYLLAWLVNVSQYLGFYFLITIMALYAIRHFQASDAAAGFAASAFVIGATVARLFTGFIVDRVGKRPVMLAALVVATVACGLYVSSSSLAVLIIVRVFHGVGYAFASTAIMAIAQSVIPESRRAEGTGYFALGSTLATAVGPATALLIVNSFSYSALFWITTATSALGLVLALFLRKPGLSGAADQGAVEEDKPQFSLRALLHPAVIPIGVFMLIIGLCYAGVITYLNGYSEDRDVLAGAGLFFVAYATAMFIMRFFLGRIQDQRGDNTVIYFGLVSFVLALALLAIANADWQVVVAGALTGMGFGTLMPATQSIAVRAVPANQVGTGISTLLLLADVGIGLGPILLGLVLPSIGYGAMFALLAGCVVIAAVFYQFIQGREGNKPAAD